MGGWYSKIGSDPYYASYERSLEGLKSSIQQLQDKVENRQKNLAAVEGTIFMYGLAGFAIAAGVAIWALQQPAGVLSSRQHFMSVLPMFVEPIGAYALYVFWNTLQSVLGKRDKARLAAAEAKLRKMITELKDTTHYQKTLSILSKYDPDFVPPSPLPMMGKAEPRTPGGPLPFRSLRSEMPASAVKDTPRRTALGRMTGAGVSLMPALDKIASSLIGDNPALMQALREAKSEAEALRQRLASSEARAAKLAAQNSTMRERLGDAAGDLEPPPSPPSAATQEAAGPSTALGNAQQGPSMLSRLSNISTPGFQDGSPAPSSDRKSISAPATPMASIAGAPADFAQTSDASPGTVPHRNTVPHQLQEVGEDRDGRDSGDGSFTFVGHAEDPPMQDLDTEMKDSTPSVPGDSSPQH
ncbi:hypothetical protein WJX73_003957 [Symbiochloris irregularis]|uniref:Uncharacterized protein n=1 Tax=Symbiochloris irregularis TaxID=706552 RepID=A0AAW1Q1C0_9CHLO